MAVRKILKSLSNAVFGNPMDGYAVIKEDDPDGIQNEVAHQDRHNPTIPYPGSVNLRGNDDEIIGMPTHLPGFNKV